MITGCEMCIIRYNVWNAFLYALYVQVKIISQATKSSSERTFESTYKLHLAEL